MAIRPRRSALYMPGSNARTLEKAKTLAADVHPLSILRPLGLHRPLKR